MSLHFSSLFEGRMPKPVDGTISDAFKCALCENLLFNAMLITECGCKFCETPCFQQLMAEEPRTCPGGTEDCGPFENGLPDKGTRRNILNLKVKCINDCGYAVIFRDLPKHLEDCSRAPTPCSFCKNHFPKCDLESHENQCPQRCVICEYCSDNILFSGLSDHHNLLSPNCCSAFRGPCPYCKAPDIHRSGLKKHKKECKQWPVECPYQNVGCQFRGKDLKAHLNDSVPHHQQLLLKLVTEKQDALELENERLRQENNNLRESCQNLKVKTEELKTEFNERWTKFKKVQSMLANCREKQIDTEKIVEQYGNVQGLLARFVSSNATPSGSTSLPLNAQHSSSVHSGIYLWRIDNYRRRRMEAKQGTVLSLTSDPFFSEAYGYRMCCRVYLNGDGSGKGTHLSVFIVIMKSEYDSILKWPFTNRVTFTLINQEHGDNRVETFSPDQRSYSFKRPTEDMNIASGCPRFISFAQLEGTEYRSPFLQDDTIFLRIQVERSVSR